ncbi:16 kDa phloem protein 1 [Mangifera indica]|uniref:16 kDa phloem protein 1 n=1 Tax=Mangifera indica TaxID=29780 RepID=UPI001CFA140F|nr:16 kDa phloem protein 1 [Mangifera indica]
MLYSLEKNYHHFIFTRERERMATGLLEVHLVNAKGLTDTDFLGNIDPYVVMQYKGQERKSSVAQGQGGIPTWNEKFTFRVEYPGGGGQYKLILKIMDKDTFSPDDFLGEATIYMEDFLSIGMENGSAELHPRKYNVVQADGTYCGEIQVGLTLTRQYEQATERDFGGWKESDVS